MASLYRRARSPYWWIRMKANGAWVSKNTGLRLDSPLDTKRAHILCVERTAQESTGDTTSTGWAWVHAFLRHAAPSDLTRTSYVLRWRHVSEFLVERGLSGPSAVRYEHVQEYVTWRLAQKRHCGKPIARNTAVAEAKVWKTVMLEAVNRGILESSPIARAKLRRNPPPEKPEITAAEQATIEAALKNEPPWMRRSWAIAMATGCRLRETRIELRHVDLAAARLTFPSPKGGSEKAYAIPLPPALRPLFEEMRSARERVTLDFPFQPSRQWGLFFARLGLAHLCFHCTRVTFISRLARAGAPLSVAMRLVNHASTAIHRIYQRVQLDDCAGWSDRAAQAPSASAENLPAKSADRSEGIPAIAPTSARYRKKSPAPRPVAAT